jgi:hypothetical protein
MLWGVFSAFRVTGGCLARWADPAVAAAHRLKSSADNRRVISRILSQGNDLAVFPARQVTNW